jgi:hypothetical protein
MKRENGKFRTLETVNAVTLPAFYLVLPPESSNFGGGQLKKRSTA